MISTLIIFVAFAVWLLRMWTKRKTLPPGPFPLPLIGNIHVLAYEVLIQKKTFVDILSENKQKYGGVLTLWLGPIATVHLCDYDSTVEAMVKNGSSFINRDLPFLFHYSRGGRGLLASSGLFWQEQRRFALHTLRNFGLGRNIIEERIMFEFEYTCEELEKQMHNGEISIQPNQMFDLLIGNIINRLLFTDRFEKDQESTFFRLKNDLDNIFDRFEPWDALINRWTMNIPFFRRRAEALLQPQNDLLKFLSEQVKKRQESVANGQHVFEGEGDDFVDAFLIQVEREAKSEEGSSFNRENLNHVLLDLWAAGQETTATTLIWAFVYLLLHDEVKTRATDELRQVTKGSRLLSLADKNNTPYYNAVLTEIHRCAAIFPTNLPRRADDNVSVGGYVIPKGTSVSAQVSLTMSDERYFKNSEQFNPDRFLNADKLEQQVIPFGMGRRACLGESLARAELYLIIGNFLLRYSVTSDPEYLPSMSPKLPIGIIKKSLPYHIVFKRNKFPTTS